MPIASLVEQHLSFNHSKVVKKSQINSILVNSNKELDRLFFKYITANIEFRTDFFALHLDVWLRSNRIPCLWYFIHAIWSNCHFYMNIKDLKLIFLRSIERKCTCNPNIFEAKNESRPQYTTFKTSPVKSTI